MRILNFSDDHNSLLAVIDQVIEDADVTVISRRDAPDAVVMSFDYYSSLMETVHLLRSPANAAHLAKSIDQARSGRATRPQALGALAVGAVAFGALAIGAFAIGRLTIGRARIKRLEIDEVVVRTLRVTQALQLPSQAGPENST